MLTRLTGCRGGILTIESSSTVTLRDVSGGVFKPTYHSLHVWASRNSPQDPFVLRLRWWFSRSECHGDLCNPVYHEMNACVDNVAGCPLSGPIAIRNSGVRSDAAGYVRIRRQMPDGTVRNSKLPVRYTVESSITGHWSRLFLSWADSGNPSYAGQQRHVSTAPEGRGWRVLNPSASISD